MTLAGFLAAYGSALILPLSVIEGPIVSVAAGFIAARGYVAWPWAVCLLMAGELIGDLIYYWVGRTGAAPLVVLGRRAGLRRQVSPQVQRGLRENATKMLLIGNWTHAIGFVVLVGSGMLRIPLPRFLLVNFLAALPKLALTFGFGFFAGNHIDFFERHGVMTTAVLAAAGIAAVSLVMRQGFAEAAGRSDP